MFEKHEEYIDTRSGMHVVKLRNEAGHEHLVQVFIGHTGCPACGAVQHSEGRDIDPQAVVERVIADLEASHRAMLDYAEKHGVPIR